MHRILKVFAPLSLEVVAVLYDFQDDTIEAIKKTFVGKGLYVTCYAKDKVFTGALDSEEFTNYISSQLKTETNGENE